MAANRPARWQPCHARRRWTPVPAFIWTAAASPPSSCRWARRLSVDPRRGLPWAPRAVLVRRRVGAGARARVVASTVMQVSDAPLCLRQSALLHELARAWGGAQRFLTNRACSDFDLQVGRRAAAKAV